MRFFGKYFRGAFKLSTHRNTQNRDKNKRGETTLGRKQIDSFCANFRQGFFPKTMFAIFACPLLPRVRSAQNLNKTQVHILWRFS
jgi:hypothetical protein